jgi:hypothetical protein
VTTLRVFHLAHFSKPTGRRAIYRHIRHHRPRSIVQIGLGDLQLSLTALWLSVELAGGERVRFTGIDLFELRPSEQQELALKQAHRELAAHDAKIKLIPGEPHGALARSANSLTGTELLIVSNDFDNATLAPAWFYLPRMLGAASSVFEQDDDADFQQLTTSEIARRAGGHENRRAA